MAHRVNAAILAVGDAASTAEQARADRMKAVLVAPNGHVPGFARTVHPRDTPQQVANVASAQVHARAMATEDGPLPGTRNSDYFAPALLKDRSFKAGVPVLWDTRKRAAERVAGTSAGGMPSGLVVPNYKGVAGHEVDELLFAGQALTEHDAKAVSEAGHDENQTIRTAGDVVFINFSETSFRNGSVVSMGPPPMKQVMKEDGTVDESQYMRSNIYQLRDGETGDFSTCPPVPRLLTVAGHADRFATVDGRWQENPASDQFSDKHRKNFMRRGTPDDAMHILYQAWKNARLDGHAETTAHAEIRHLMLEFRNEIRALLPESSHLVPHPKTGVMGAVDVAGVWTELPANAFIPIPDDKGYRAFLASFMRARPGGQNLKLADAIHDYELRLGKTLAQFKVGRARGGGAAAPNPPHADAKQNEIKQYKQELDNFLKAHCFGKADDVLTQASASTWQVLYATIRRYHVFSYALQKIGRMMKVNSGIMGAMNAQAHMLVTADSNPGGPLKGTLLLHAT